MKIGIDCRRFYDIVNNRGAGVERFAYHFVKNLLIQDRHNDYVLFFYNDISPDTIHKLKGNNPRVKIIKVVKQKKSLPIWHNHIKFNLILNKEKLDLTVFPTGSMPLFYSGKSYLIVHDLAIYLHPEWFPDKQWLSTKIVVPRSFKQADKIIAVSENTKLDIVKMFQVSSEKIFVIYPGVKVKHGYIEEEVEKVQNKYDIKGDYVLFLGTMEPRKNIINLIKAFSAYIFEDENANISLVLAGVKGWKYKDIFLELEGINKRLVKGQVKYIGTVSNRERNILISNCKLFAFPSQYEGFGFPVLEAMALDAPVLTGDNSSLKEISGEAACLVNTGDANEIRKGIKKVLDDKYLRANLIQKGRERIKLFTWENTINNFLRIIKEER